MAEMGGLVAVDWAHGPGDDRRVLVRDTGLVGRPVPAGRNPDHDPAGPAEGGLHVPVAPSPVLDCRRNADRPRLRMVRRGRAQAAGRPGPRRAQPPRENRLVAMSMPSPRVEGGALRQHLHLLRVVPGLARDPLPEARPDRRALVGNLRHLVVDRAGAPSRA